MTGNANTEACLVLETSGGGVQKKDMKFELEIEPL